VNKDGLVFFVHACGHKLGQEGGKDEVRIDLEGLSLNLISILGQQHSHIVASSLQQVINACRGGGQQSSVASEAQRKILPEAHTAFAGSLSHGHCTRRECFAEGRGSCQIESLGGCLHRLRLHEAQPEPPQE
jgi:hypothetical protein